MRWFHTCNSGPKSKPQPPSCFGVVQSCRQSLISELSELKLSLGMAYGNRITVKSIFSTAEGLISARSAHIPNTGYRRRQETLQRQGARWGWNLPQDAEDIRLCDFVGLSQLLPRHLQTQTYDGKRPCEGRELAPS